MDVRDHLLHVTSAAILCSLEQSLVVYFGQVRRQQADTAQRERDLDPISWTV
jgi:hypothetical protein